MIKVAYYNAKLANALRSLAQHHIDHPKLMGALTGAVSGGAMGAGVGAVGGAVMADPGSRMQGAARGAAVGGVLGGASLAAGNSLMLRDPKRVAEHQALMRDYLQHTGPSTLGKGMKPNIAVNPQPGAMPFGNAPAPSQPGKKPFG